VWAIVALLALGNLGVNVTALVAGLGIGGVAIALAVQTVLGDLLASLSIAFDKPFRIGDTLGIDDYTGTVESIGIKSTRLRSISGEQLIVSNADLLKSRVRNLGRMPEQRALVQLNIDYENSHDKLDQVAPIAERVVTAQPNTSFKYCVFRNFGPTALEFELSYYVKEPKGLSYLTTVDAVNRRLQRELAEQAIRFSYPSRQPFQALREPKTP
jgi:small-conductance mechanosensitive channel